MKGPLVAGFGYTFFNDKLRDYSKPLGYDEFSGHIYDILQPLVRQPGEGWEYGVRSKYASTDTRGWSNVFRSISTGLVFFSSESLDFL
jgi:hypothetical protein